MSQIFTTAEAVIIRLEDPPLLSSETVRSSTKAPSPLPTYLSDKEFDGIEFPGIELDLDQMCAFTSTSDAFISFSHHPSLSHPILVILVGLSINENELVRHLVLFTKTSFK